MNWWPLTRQRTDNAVAQHLATVRVSARVRGIGKGVLAAKGKDLPPPKSWAGTAARRFAETLAGVVPADNTVAKFIEWRIGHLSYGDIEQKDLRQEYETMCAIAGFQPTSVIAFWDDLYLAGCDRHVHDRRRFGKGPRVYVVSVPREFKPRPAGAAKGSGQVLPLPARSQVTDTGRPRVRHFLAEGPLGNRDARSRQGHNNKSLKGGLGETGNQMEVAA